MTFGGGKFAQMQIMKIPLISGQTAQGILAADYHAAKIQAQYAFCRHKSSMGNQPQASNYKSPHGSAVTISHHVLDRTYFPAINIQNPQAM